jgi:hypothetical protein
MDSNRREQPVQRLELYIRSLIPSGTCRHQEYVVGRLQQLEEAGYVEDSSVTVWGSRTCLSSPVSRTEMGQTINACLADFTEWARENGKTLRPCFETTEVSSELADEEFTAVILPIMALVEYGEDGIQFVSPCSDGTQVYTVRDRVDRLVEAAGIEEEAVPLADQSSEDRSERAEAFLSGSG